METQQHLACPHCNAINRIPAARLNDQPKCGQCKQPLFTGQSIALSDAAFSAHAQRSTMPLVVDFWAPWCGPCKTMAPYLERAAAQLEPHFRVAKLNADDYPDIAGRYNIRSIPTIVLFSNGREVARRSGAMDSNSLVTWIRSQA